MSLEIFCPSDAESVQSRNLLLQKSLRPTGLPYSIDQEYPILLSPDYSDFSFCIRDGRDIVGHLNVWPRIVKSSNPPFEFPIALIGNVATDATHRGKGFMAKLITQALQDAERMKFAAVLLWSDLLEFYQKFGFRSFGAELRLSFSLGENLISSSLGSGELEILTNPPLTEDLISAMKGLRPRVASEILRSDREFSRLFRIPETWLLLLVRNGEIVSYGIVGKGYDLSGVIHEWGAKSPTDLLGLVQGLLIQSGWGDVTVLAPTNLGGRWQNKLNSAADYVKAHPVGLMRSFANDSRVLSTLESLFVWGFDSI
jgi:predicted N-acetyltransferase YhbS